MHDTCIMPATRAEYTVITQRWAYNLQFTFLATVLGTSRLCSNAASVVRRLSSLYRKECIVANR